MCEWITRLFKGLDRSIQEDVNDNMSYIFNKLKNIEGLQNILLKYSYKVEDEYDSLLFFKFKHNCGKSESEIIRLMAIKPNNTRSYEDYFIISVARRDYNKVFYTKELTNYQDTLLQLESIFNNMSKAEQSEFISAFTITLNKLFEFLKNVDLSSFKDEKYLLTMEVLNQIIVNCENQIKQETNILREDILMEIKYLKRINEGEPSNFEKMVTAYDSEIN